MAFHLFRDPSSPSSPRVFWCSNSSTKYFRTARPRMGSVFHFYRVRNISPLQFAQSEGYPAQPWARISRVLDLFSYWYGQRYISILTSLYLEIEIDWICTVTYIYVKRNNNKAPPLTFVAVLHWRNAIPSYLFPFPPRQFCLHRSPRITFPSLYNYISCSHPFRYCRPSADSLSDLYQPYTHEGEL